MVSYNSNNKDGLWKILNCYQFCPSQNENVELALYKNIWNGFYILVSVGRAIYWMMQSNAVWQNRHWVGKASKTLGKAIGSAQQGVERMLKIYTLSMFIAVLTGNFSTKRKVQHYADADYIIVCIHCKLIA